MEILTALGELPDPQVALTILRHCASFGKLVYSLRVIPHQKHREALHCYDNAVRDCIESFLCCSFTDTEWSLASLSTKLGGLGLRNLEQHSSAAYIASQAACHDLCIKLDPNYVWDPKNAQSDFHSAILDLNTRVEPDKQLQANADTFPRQQVLSQNVDCNTLASIRAASANDVHFQAHLNHTSASGASSWLQVVPARALGTHVDPLLYRTIVQHWLRVPIYEQEFHCHLCGEVVDRFGDHCLTCACGGDRTKRHNLIRNEVFHFCNSSGLNPELERPGLLQPRLVTGII